MMLLFCEVIETVIVHLLRKQKGHTMRRSRSDVRSAASVSAISTKQESDEHLLLLHRRLRRESGTLTKQKEPRLEIALVLLLFRSIEIIILFMI